MTIIAFAGLEVEFLEDGDSTKGEMDLFTTLTHPGAGMPIPHYHKSWDETVFGLSGVVTWQVDGQEIAIAAGQSAFIPRGAVHSFINCSDTPARFLSILTPGCLGSEYFRKTADLVNSGVASPVAMKALMTHYGLIPIERAG